jgi:hypothetical protein
MSPLWFLTQVMSPNPPETPTAPASIPVDEGSYGLSVVVATLITLLILFLICSPIRRD